MCSLTKPASEHLAKAGAEALTQPHFAHSVVIHREEHKHVLGPALAAGLHLRNLIGVEGFEVADQAVLCLSGLYGGLVGEQVKVALVQGAKRLRVNDTQVEAVAVGVVVARDELLLTAVDFKARLRLEGCGLRAPPPRRVDDERRLPDILLLLAPLLEAVQRGVLVLGKCCHPCSRAREP